MTSTAPSTGCICPATVVDKIYRRNAEGLFGGAWDAPTKQ